MSNLNLDMEMPALEKVKNNSIYLWLIFVGCCTIMLTCIGIAMSCLGLFVNVVSTECKVGTTPMSLMFTIMFASTMAALPFIGKLMSKGRIRLFTTDAVLTLGCLWICMGLTTAMWQFYIIAVGLGAAMASAIMIGVVLGKVFIGWLNDRLGATLGAMIGISFGVVARSSSMPFPSVA